MPLDALISALILSGVLISALRDIEVLYELPLGDIVYLIFTRLLQSSSRLRLGMLLRLFFCILIFRLPPGEITFL